MDREAPPPGRPALSRSPAPGMPSSRTYEGSTRPPELAHAAPEPAPEKRAQRRSVAITDLRGDDLQVVAGGSQEVRRHLDPYVLHECHRRFPQHRAHAPPQRAPAPPPRARGGGERKGCVEMVADPAFEAFHHVVGVREVIGD